LVSLLGLLLVLAGGGGTLRAADPVRPSEERISFRNDVMAVLSKAGCNMGVCHGNQNGKGGLKLSLRGQSPDDDFTMLTRDFAGRRTDRLEPDQSLILLKPALRIAHEGGRRFTPAAPEYALLRQWIAAGMPRDPKATPQLVRIEVEPREQILLHPADRIQLHVTARFSDGSQRDVSGLAVYEPADPFVECGHDGLLTARGPGETTIIVRYLERQAPVRLAFVPARPGWAWTGPPPANYVDEQVFAKLRALRINPAPVCSDAEFLRRASLDLLGLIPTADEARQFAASSSPQKRAALIDRLLDRPEFADFWALKWSDLLRNEEKTLDRKGVQNFHAWIRQSIAQGKPLDQFARELIASRGSTYEHPESNYYRAMREPLMRAESTAQIFLGTRLQCARCHNHPFDRWTQDDYYSWANVFARVDYKIVENQRRDTNDKHEFDGEQIVWMPREGDVDDPRTGKPLPPRFLDDEKRGPRAEHDRLLELASWVGSPRNERFVQTQVNRIWYHLFGRGIVDPIDDFRATNPPANAALLKALADDCIAHNFDLRHMLREIMNSRTYQLSAATNDTNRDDLVNFSHAVPRRLAAEQLLDSLGRVLDVPLEFNGYPPGLRAGELPGVQAVRSRTAALGLGDRFLEAFGKPPRLQSCECERSEETTLNQTFQLVSGPLINELLTRPENRLKRLLASGQPPRAILVELYWTTLSREPSAEELSVTATYLERAQDRRKALEDIAWGLLNSHEFMLRP
jgi:hypothetical protein